MSAHEVSLRLGLHEGELVVDGEDWSAFVAPEVMVQRVRGAPVRVSVELLTASLVARGSAWVEVGERTRAALVALGWCPPMPTPREIAGPHRYRTFMSVPCCGIAPGDHLPGGDPS